jgi:hypothetical protein
MRLLRFLSRVAFICNVCFLVTSFIQWLPNPPEGELISTIIILGYVLSVLVNVLVNISVAMLLCFGRLRKAGISAWLLIVNFLFFVTQLVLILIHILK